MLNRLKSIMNYAIWALSYSIVNICALIASGLFGIGKEYRDSWLIAELPGEARDNGYWLYKYIVKEHPEINVYYAINSASPDYQRLPAKDKVIEYGSFKHYLAHILCSRSISSHIYGASPGRYFCRPFTPLMRNKTEIFLQHGILANVINLRGYSGLTIYTADSEKDLFIKSGHKEPGNLKQTGLARFDGLSDESSVSNILLIMPTFRSYLRNLSSVVSDDEFIASTFYQKWSSLLNSADFQNLIDQSNLNVIFYPHRQMQVFNHLWNFGSQITLGTPDTHDIQKLLKGSKLMLTDYSSTYYDFMYMKKPAIAYQFDKKEVLGSHYKASGKYPLIAKTTTESGVINEIGNIVNEGYKLSTRVSGDIDKFYPHRDSNNRERIFEVIEAAGL